MPAPLARVRHYLRVYRAFVETSFAEASSYRIHFVLLILLDLFFYATSLAGVSFIFDHVDRIGDWDRARFLFFVSFMLAIDHLHMTFISSNFWIFSHDLRIGKLDFILLRPLGALFTVFFRYVRSATLCNTPVPWIMMVVFALRAGLHPAKLLLLPPLVLLGFALAASLEILVAMSMFWVVEATSINFLRMQLQQLSRWPDFTYRFWARKLFSIGLPILLVGSGPVRFLLDPTDVAPLAGMLVAILATWLAIAVAWRRGLRAYESASS